MHAYMYAILTIQVQMSFTCTYEVTHLVGENLPLTQFRQFG